MTYPPQPVGGSVSLRGAQRSTVKTAIDERDPFPGTRGFAGAIDGRLVRDVLGRQPLYVEREGTSWAFDRWRLDDPVTVPGGQVYTEDDRRQCWTLPRISPPENPIRSVRSALDGALSSVESQGVAIAFSGGVDSALLGAHIDAPLYVAGFPGSHDIFAAKSAARRLDREIRVVELDIDMLVEAIPEVVRAIGTTNAMAVEIALPLFLVAKQTAVDGFDRLAIGQGADEVFGGYAKVARAPEDPRVDAETIRDARREVLETLPGQLQRDIAAIRAGGVEPVMGLLDDRVIEAGLSLPGSLLVSPRGERKYALRLAAREWLPDPIAFREKKALQYGSLVARELDREARQSGFKRRIGDHISKYIDSLIE